MYLVYPAGVRHDQPRFLPQEIPSSFILLLSVLGFMLRMAAAPPSPCTLPLVRIPTVKGSDEFQGIEALITLFSVWRRSRY
jgi:hypothetical protein